jgi:hypothetical protein
MQEPICPVDAYYAIYDQLCYLHGYQITNSHGLSKYLGVLLQLASKNQLLGEEE